MYQSIAVNYTVRKKVNGKYRYYKQYKIGLYHSEEEARNSSVYDDGEVRITVRSITPISRYWSEEVASDNIHQRYLAVKQNNGMFNVYEYQTNAGYGRNPIAVFLSYEQVKEMFNK